MKITVKTLKGQNFSLEVDAADKVRLARVHDPIVSPLFFRHPRWFRTSLIRIAMCRLLIVILLRSKGPSGRLCCLCPG